MLELQLPKIISTVSSILKMIKDDNERLYDRHIIELDGLVKESHRYYHDSFKAILASLNSQTPSHDVIAHLKDLRRDHQSRKMEILELSAALKEGYAGLTILNERQNLLVDFLDATVDYFNSSTTVGGASWFSDFIRFAENRHESGDSEPWPTRPFGNNPVVDLTEQVECILDELLPMRYERYLNSFSSLKVYLNK
ncbi:hypothetical protein ACMXYW_05900 [Neptuniibacter sp. QD48_55]|uniref:hypothetical protein n=1 Tax=Neptuniibacter sp. QD48_55 TaxID=3398212 RepID=UPI0039F5D5F2